MSWRSTRTAVWLETHLVEVDDTHGDFSQTLSSVDVGLRRPRDTTPAKLRADSILEKLLGRVR